MLPRSLAHTLAICFAAAASLSANPVSASGFAVPENSIAGVGLANALVANPHELGALTYNPAAMAFQDASSFTLGVIGVAPDIGVKTASGSHGSKGRSLIPVPAFFGALKIDDTWSLGLGVSGPFGLDTEWRLGTFPTLSQPTTAALHPTLSELEVVDIAATASYRIHEHASVAAGIDYYSANKLKFNTTLIDIQGTGDAWGWNLAFLYDLERWSVGLSYHSDAKIIADGKFQPFPPAGPGTAIPAEANVDIPWRLQLGARYAVNDALALEFDITRTGWSNFKQIKVKATGILPSGSVLTTSSNDWKDANAYRLGLTYQVDPKIQLRFGYSYDQTPQDNDHFSARIPDADRQLFSIGLDYGLQDGWGLEAGYMYVRFKDRNYNSPVPFGSYGSDPNGTDAYNGKYNADVNLFGLGIRKSFL